MEGWGGRKKFFGWGKAYLPSCTTTPAQAAALHHFTKKGRTGAVREKAQEKQRQSSQCTCRSVKSCSPSAHSGVTEYGFFP